MENRKAAANAIVYTLLVVFAIITLIPFAHMLAGALKTKFDYAATLFLPAGDGFLGIGWDRITLDNFRRLFGELAFGRAMLITLFLASVHAILTVLFCSMGGYALSKLRFKGREFVTTLVLTALIIPGPLLLAPGFQLLYQLGLLNTYTGLILPGLTPAFGVFLFRQAMLNGVIQIFNRLIKYRDRAGSAACSSQTWKSERHLAFHSLADNWDLVRRLPCCVL